MLSLRISYRRRILLNQTLNRELGNLVLTSIKSREEVFVQHQSLELRVHALFGKQQFTIPRFMASDFIRSKRGFGPDNYSVSDTFADPDEGD